MQLMDDGNLMDVGYDENHDINFNLFNIDCVFRWRFAPGSDIFIVWKNIIGQSDPELINSFTQNLRSTFQSAQTNSISLRLLYFIDFARFRKKGTVETTQATQP